MTHVSPTPRLLNSQRLISVYHANKARDLGLQMDDDVAALIVDTVHSGGYYWKSPEIDQQTDGTIYYMDLPVEKPIGRFKVIINVNGKGVNGVFGGSHALPVAISKAKQIGIDLDLWFASDLVRRMRAEDPTIQVTEEPDAVAVAFEHIRFGWLKVVLKKENGTVLSISQIRDVVHPRLTVHAAERAQERLGMKLTGAQVAYIIRLLKKEEHDSTVSDNGTRTAEIPFEGTEIKVVYNASTYSIVTVMESAKVRAEARAKAEEKSLTKRTQADERYNRRREMMKVMGKMRARASREDDADES